MDRIMKSPMQIGLFRLSERIQNSMKKKSRITAKTAGLLAALLLLSGQQVKAADAARVSGTADVCIVQVDASYSGGADASASFFSKEANMNGTLDRPGAWAYYTIQVQNQGNADARLSKAELCDETPAYLTVTSGVKDEHIGDVLKPGETRKIGVLVQWNEDAAMASAEETGSYCLTLVFDGASDSPDTSDENALFWLCAGFSFTAGLAGILYRKGRRTN